MARFFRRGVTKVKFLPTVAGTSPTRAEITAGTDLTIDLAEISGFQFKNDPISVPDLNSNFTSQIVGEDTAESPTLTFYDQDNSTIIRTAIAKNVAGYIWFVPYGDVPTKRGEVWPVKSTGVNDEIVASNDPARFMVTFAVTATPNLNAVIPS